MESTPTVELIPPPGSCYCQSDKPWYNPGKCEMVAKLQRKQKEWEAESLERKRQLEVMYNTPYKSTLKPYEQLTASGRKHRRAKVRRLLAEKEHLEPYIPEVPEVEPEKQIEPVV